MKAQLVAVALVPVLGLVAGSAAQAASDPSEVLIPELSADYIGPLSTAGKKPQIDVEATQVSRAFTKYLTYKNVAKVAKGTDGQAMKKGTKATVNGFRCKVTAFRYVNPGTAGQYSVADWRCTFQAADTATRIVLEYEQASL